MKRYYWVSLSFLLFVCFSTVSAENSVLKQQLLNPNINMVSSSKNDLSKDMLIAQALSLGVQGGLYETMKKILNYVQIDSELHDQNYPFKVIMMDINGFLVLPAKLQKINGRISIEDKMVRTGRESYRIEQQPKFVTAIPTFHDYMSFDIKPPMIRSDMVLPKAANLDLWRAKVIEGWNSGSEQAYVLFERRMNRLVNDFQSYITYHLARQYNLVSAPEFVESSYPVTGGGEVMTIGESLLKISVNPSLNNDRDTWKPLPQLPAIPDLIN